MWKLTSGFKRVVNCGWGSGKWVYSECWMGGRGWKSEGGGGGGRPKPLISCTEYHLSKFKHQQGRPIRRPPKYIPDIIRTPQSSRSSTLPCSYNNMCTAQLEKRWPFFQDSRRIKIVLMKLHMTSKKYSRDVFCSNWHVFSSSYTICLDCVSQW